MEVVGFATMRPVVRMPCSSRPPRPWTSVVVAIGGLTLAGPAGSDPIDEAAPVVRDEQRAGRIDRDGDRVVEARGEGRDGRRPARPDHDATDLPAAVVGEVLPPLGHEEVAVEGLAEGAAAVDDEAVGRRVRLEVRERPGDAAALAQQPLAAIARPAGGPAEAPALAHLYHRLRRLVVSELVALVDRGVEPAGRRVHGEPEGVP